MAKGIKDKPYNRECPSCGKILNYSRKSHVREANQKESKCYQCGNNSLKIYPKKANELYEWICSSCRVPQYVKTRAIAVNNILNKSTCRSCSAKNRKSNSVKTESRFNIKKGFYRNCPSCNRQIFHKKKYYRDYSERDGKKCISCCKIGVKQKRASITSVNYKYIFTYQTKNLINGKTYIGVRCTNNLNDGYIGCGVVSQKSAINRAKKTKSMFVSAVVKHGYENFKREILSFHETPKEAYEDEEYMVDKIWVKSKENYNVSLGGSTSKTVSKYDKFIGEWVKLYKKGESMSSIAKKYGLSSHASVSILLRGLV